MTTTPPPPSTCKVRSSARSCKAASLVLPPFAKPSSPKRLKRRRDLFGGQRGQGRRHRCPVHRPDPARVRRGAPHPSLTAFGGLADFGRFLEQSGVDAKLRSLCAPLKTGKGVVYPMHAQVRLLLDLLVVGGARIFDLERIAHDPLVCHLAGGPLCSVDTLYRDVDRFDDQSLEALRQVVTSLCLARLKKLPGRRVHLDIDTTVLPVAGEEIEGAVPGYNPRYPGRPSYHPVVARVAETNMFLGAVLRPGNTTFGKDEAELVATWTRQVVEAAGPRRLVYVRIDKAGHCGEILRAIEKQKAFYLVKGQLTAKFAEEIAGITNWTTVEQDAEESALEEVGEFVWESRDNQRRGLAPMRVIVVRSRERQGGKQLPLFAEAEMNVQVILTNDTFSPAEDLVAQYDGRAGIEPLLAEGKQEWGMEKVSSKSFAGNEALLQLKLLALNALHAMALAWGPREARRFRSSWLRELLIVRPALLVRSGRSLWIRMGAGPRRTKRE